MSVKVNPVGWFEIPVQDLARAKSFYEHVFELELEDHQMGEFQLAMFPMQDDVLGAGGSLTHGEGYAASPDGVVIYFTAPDIEAALSRVQAKGGKVLSGKTDIGEHGFIAFVQDTEGNRVGLHSRT